MFDMGDVLVVFSLNALVKHESDCVHASEKVTVGLRLCFYLVMATCGCAAKFCK